MLRRPQPPLHGVRFEPRHPAYPSEAPSTSEGTNWSLNWLDTPPRIAGSPLWRWDERGVTRFALYRTLDNAIALYVSDPTETWLRYRPSALDVFASSLDVKEAMNGLGMAVGLEVEGIPCLHATVVRGSTHAIALAADSQVGKSTLATALLCSGYQLVSDDMLALWPGAASTWECFTSSPELRLWDDGLRALKHHLPDLKASPRYPGDKKYAVMLPESFMANASHPHRINAFVTLCPANASSGLTRLKGIHAIQQVLMHSLIGGAARVLGLEASRFEKLSAFVNDVPVYTLDYVATQGGLDEARHACEQLLRSSER